MKAASEGDNHTHTKRQANNVNKKGKNLKDQKSKREKRK